MSAKQHGLVSNGGSEALKKDSADAEAAAATAASLMQDHGSDGGQRWPSAPPAHAAADDARVEEEPELRYLGFAPPPLLLSAAMSNAKKAPVVPFETHATSELLLGLG